MKEKATKTILTNFNLCLLGVLCFVGSVQSQTINTFPYNQDFEGETQGGTSCYSIYNMLSTGWTNETTDDVDWTPDVGGTISSSTGPSIDHNPGTSTDFYLYLESSTCYSKTGGLTSPYFNFTSLIDPRVSIWYHMYGADMGTMHLDARIGATSAWTNDIVPAWTDNQNLWQELDLALTAYAGLDSFQLRVRGITGTGFTSDMAIDDITIYQLPLCIDPPTAGTTVSTSTLACPSTNFTLSLTGGTMGAGQTYQWQDSPDGITWTNITGATNDNYIGTISTATYFRCNVTCGTGSDISSSILINSEIFTNCYCNDSYATSSSWGYIQNVTFNTINNTSPVSCQTYTDYSTINSTIFKGASYPFQTEIGNCSSGSYSHTTKVYIDYNQNGSFTDPGEEVLVLGPGVYGIFNGNITVSSAALVGLTGMRVVTVETSSPASVIPCGTYSFGETEDYMVNIQPPPVNDAGILAITTPTNFLCDISNLPVTITLENMGTDTLQSATINYWINGTLQTPMNWTGNILPFGNLPGVVIGTQSFFNNDTLVIETSLPNGVNDSIPANDNIQMIVTKGLSGIYTIGGIAPDYTSFTSAVNALVSNGICGSVVFNVNDSIYNEQIVLPEIIGASDTSTITFQSLSGNSSMSGLTFSGSSTVDNYTVQFNGGDYITFNELTIENPGTTYGRAMEFSNGSTWNNLSNCIIRGDTNNTSSLTNKAVIYSGSGSSLDHNNTFSNNLVHGGSYGIYWYGDGSSSLESGTVIYGNTFKDQFSYGAYLYYQNAPKFNNNTVSSNTTNATFYRTYFRYCDNELEIMNNKLLGNQNGYGIYMYYCDASSTKQGYIANNFIRVGDALSTTTAYGLYINSSGFQNIVNNNVLMESNGTLTRALYVSSGGANKVFNNNLTNNGPGYAVYYASSFSVIESDYNNLFAPSGSFSYFGGAYPNLGDWQLNTGYDLNSISVNPNYYGDQDLHVCNDSLNNMGVPLQMITNDVDGDTRNSIPDIGADEFVPVDNLNLGSDTAICPGAPLTLGFSDASSTYSWSTGATTPAITVSNAGSYFVSATNTCGTGSDTIVVTNAPLPDASFAATTSFLTGVFTTAGNMNTYLWNFGDGNSSTSADVTHVYTNTGSYNVQLVVTNDCGSDSTTTTVFVSPTGINDQLLSDNVSVYPNPNNGLFSITIGNINSSVNIDMHDIHGKNVYHNNIKSTTGEINRQIDLTNSISTGVYFIKITTEKEVLVKKIVVN